MTTNWMERWAGGGGRLARMLARAGSIGLMGWATLAYADHPLQTLPFFTGEALQSNGVYLLSSSIWFFGYYNYIAYPPYICHYDLGCEVFIDAADGASGAYFWDSHFQWLYTTPGTFPYLYGFNVGTGAWLWYEPDASRPNHYTSNPRCFVNMTT